jgi:hypothetical protein
MAAGLGSASDGVERISLDTAAGGVGHSFYLQHLADQCLVFSKTINPPHDDAAHRTPHAGPIRGMEMGLSSSA